MVRNRIGSSRMAMLLAAALLLNACGRVDYSTNTARLENGKRADNTVMWFSFEADKEKDPYRMPLVRVKEGYELQAPISQEGNVSTMMTFSRTSNLDWFVGPRLSFAF